MSKLSLASHNEPVRHETIGLRTIVKYDPMAPRSTTPMALAEYIVARRPLHGSNHTLYMIMDGSTITQASISMPNADDCRTAIAKHQRKIASALTEKTIAKAKRNRRALRVREAA
jgi:hypothetical protein